MSVVSTSTPRVTITTPDASRFEVPEDVTSSGPAPGATSIDRASFDFSYTSSPFTFTISSGGNVLFASSPDLFFSDQYIELSTPMDPSRKLVRDGQRVLFIRYFYFVTLKLQKIMYSLSHQFSNNQGYYYCKTNSLVSGKRQGLILI